jgi:hypothetical protein
MSSTTITRTLATATVLVAAAAVILMRGRMPDSESLTPADAGEPTPTPIAATTAETAGANANETPAAAKLRELNALSETYRNTTFLIAIRDSGYVCPELLGVYGGVNDSGTWTATCSQMFAYTVRVVSTGALRIEPMLQHVDSITPQPEQRFEPDSGRVLPPQELPPPPR